MKIQYVVYHSYEWGSFVEQGWITMYVDTLADGTRISKMLWQGRRWL